MIVFILIYLQFKCLIETCPVQFWNSNERNDHCIEIHKMSKNFLIHFGNKYV